MIYYLLYELVYNHFKDKESYLVKALNVFQYVTFRTAYASITALLISLAFGGKLISVLSSWNIGQQIREEGPQAHLVKRGTPTMGGVFVIEALSVMLQVSFFKMRKRTAGTGRRLFRMTPLHHHFEMSGWKEPKIVFRFLILAILFALLSLSTLKLR